MARWAFAVLGFVGATAFGIWAQNQALPNATLVRIWVGVYGLAAILAAFLARRRFVAAWKAFRRPDSSRHTATEQTRNASEPQLSQPKPFDTLVLEIAESSVSLHRYGERGVYEARIEIRGRFLNRALYPTYVLGVDLRLTN